jgi:iron-sulfur cluster assembly accessory protein
MPITMTERAAREATAILAAEGKAGALLRVWVAGAGCSGLRYGLGIDEKEPEKDDTTFESQGVRLVIDPQSLSLMDGSTVSWVDDPENGGFSIENPNPPPSAGCGCAEGCSDSAGCGSEAEASGRGCGCEEKEAAPGAARGGGSCCGGD